MDPLQSKWKYERTSYAETVVDNTTRNWRHEDMDDMKNTNPMENREWTLRTGLGQREHINVCHEKTKLQSFQIIICLIYVYV